MVDIKKNKINMTRGDTLRLKIAMTVDGEEYVPQEGDVIRFAAKTDRLNSDSSDYYDEVPKILVMIPNDTMILELEPEDTKSLGFGTYAYDIQITFADGSVDTFIIGKLTLTEEVD